MSEKAIKTAARLYEMRDTAKRLLGAKYQERMREHGFVLKKIAAHEKKDVLQVAMDICKLPDCSPSMTLLMMAAAVELSEPSE